MVAVRVKLAKRESIEEVREALSALPVHTAGAEAALRPEPSGHRADEKDRRNLAWTAMPAGA